LDHCAWNGVKAETITKSLTHCEFPTNSTINSQHEIDTNLEEIKILITIAKNRQIIDEQVSVDKFIN
jgi:hypothetical protein